MTPVPILIFCKIKQSWKQKQEIIIVKSIYVFIFNHQMFSKFHFTTKSTCDELFYFRLNLHVLSSFGVKALADIFYHTVHSW